MSKKLYTFFFTTVLFCYEKANYVCGMENTEKLSEKQTRNLLNYYAMRLQFIAKESLIDKGEMTDVVSKINELSLHLRTFID